MSPELDSCKYVQLLFIWGIETVHWKNDLFKDGTGTIGLPYGKQEPESILEPFSNIYSKWVIDLHVKPKTVILWWEDLGNICDLAKDFLNITHESWFF